MRTKAHVLFDVFSVVSAVTNARFASLHGLPVAPNPSRRRPFHSAKPRARHERQECWPQQRQASVCGSAAALRSGCVPAVSPSVLHFSRSPTADRSRLLICPAPSGAVSHSAPTIRVCGQAAEPTSHPQMLRARASSERAAAERNASRTIERRGQCCPNVQERRRILRKTDG